MAGGVDEAGDIPILCQVDRMTTLTEQKQSPALTPLRAIALDSAQWVNGQ